MSWIYLGHFLESVITDLGSNLKNRRLICIVYKLITLLHTWNSHKDLPSHLYTICIEFKKRSSSQPSVITGWGLGFAKAMKSRHQGNPLGTAYVPWAAHNRKAGQEFFATLWAISDTGLDQVVMEWVELHCVSNDAKPIPSCDCGLPGNLFQNAGMLAWARSSCECTLRSVDRWRLSESKPQRNLWIVQRA